MHIRLCIVMGTEKLRPNWWLSAPRPVKNASSWLDLASARSRLLGWQAYILFTANVLLLCVMGMYR